MIRKTIATLFKLAPYIIQGINDIFLSTNDGFTYTEAEFNLIAMKYSHNIKKLKSLASLLGIKGDQLNLLPDFLEFRQVASEKVRRCVIDRLDIVNLRNLASAVIQLYETELRDKLVPKLVKEHFEVNDEFDGNDLLRETLFMDMPNELFDTVNWMTGLEFSNMQKGFITIGPAQDVKNVLHKLIDDSLLALGRIHPEKLLNLSEDFTLFPAYGRVWNIDLTSLTLTIDRTNTNNGIMLNWYSTIDELSQCEGLKYLYDFYVILKIFTRPTSEEQSIKASGSVPITNISRSFMFKKVLINDAEGKVEVAIDPKSVILSVEPVELIAEAKGDSISWETVASLHGIEESAMTYGSLLFDSSYAHDDPIFSAGAIYRTTIGTAQHSLDLTVKLLAIWLTANIEGSILDEEKVLLRYNQEDSEITIADVCNIAKLITFGHLNKKYDKNSFVQVYKTLVSDIQFMKQYFLKSSLSEGVLYLLFPALME